MRYKHYVLTKFNIRQEFDCRLKNPDNNPMLRILDEDYLDFRFDIFEKYTLPSIKNQTNQNFKWIVLFHEETPDKYLKRIKDLKKIYDFIDIYVEDGGWFNFTVYCNNNNENCDFYITTRIDNDDMFNENYIKEIQDYANQNLHKCILSFPYGEKLDLESKKHYEYVVKNNHFLSMISPKEDHIMSYNHAKILDSDNEIIFLKSDKPMWTEIVHETNVINDINIDDVEIR